MEINALLIKEQRTQKNWTQQHLADVCDLSLRTIQRVERYGTASNETVSALASVFELDIEQIILPTVEVSTYEKPSLPKWAERSLLVVSSGIFGYVLAVLTSQ
ncbi:MAG: helix-turn-helix transcriptional regulator [Gammaproteobacteria bacterium]|nr:helix-turn-helix transcriptional regulator [Gammaproteobacteria bacterium]